VRNLLSLGAALALSACAATTAPLPPPEELLLVVNPAQSTLSVVWVSGALPTALVALGSGVPADARVAAGRRYAVVATNGGDALAVIDLTSRLLARTIPLGPGAGALGAALTSDSVAYVVLSARDQLVRVDLVTGDTLSIPVGHYPKDVALARGKLFVVNANLGGCAPPATLCPIGESWITVVDPSNDGRAVGRDSIPLPGSLDASYAAVGGDGRLYVMSVGGPDAPEGRLSIVDPVDRLELGNFGGFGEAPGQIAGDNGERLFVSSRSEGLMEFNTRTRAVVRGAGSGIPVQNNTGVAVDSHSQVYAIDAGTCAQANGLARVFRPDLTEISSIALGGCSGAAVVTFIPAEVVPEGR
jgi:DNA-binding beta-propeller fold protein YncE